MNSALAGFVVWVRPLQNLRVDARRSSHGPQIERVDRVEREDELIPDDSRGINAVNRFVLTGCIRR
jgi:hypothetical protein